MTLRRIGPNVAVALYILAAFAMFIISIPNWLLDVLLAFNMAVAFFGVIYCYVQQGSSGYVLLPDLIAVHNHF